MYPAAGSLRILSDTVVMRFYIAEQILAARHFQLLADILPVQQPPDLQQQCHIEAVKGICVGDTLTACPPIYHEVRLSRYKSGQRHHRPLKGTVIRIAGFGFKHFLPQPDKFLCLFRRYAFPGQHNNVYIAPAQSEVIKDTRAVQIDRRSVFRKYPDDRGHHSANTPRFLVVPISAYIIALVAAHRIGVLQYLLPIPKPPARRDMQQFIVHLISPPIISIYVSKSLFNISPHVEILNRL